MLVENRKYLRWVVFPPPERLRPSWRTVYLQCNTARWLPTHIRKSFQSYVINLTIYPEKLYKNYSPEGRLKIRKARRLGVQIERDEDPSEVIRIFQLIARKKSLNPIDEKTFVTKPSLFVTRAISSTQVVLAAHAYSLDRQEGIVRLLYNASDFRSFEPGTTSRREAGIANVLLFHEDFLYFHRLGYFTYDFGGYGTPESGSIFKDQFNGQPVLQYNYYPLWYYWFRQGRIALRRWSR